MDLYTPQYQIMKNSEKIVDFLTTKYGENIRTLFMPHCYGMWDSMKTLYEEICKRNMTTGVMPIPYFNLVNGAIDMKAGMHYDLDSFRGEVEEKHLCNFNNFEHFKKFVDFIIFSNPYDDSNNMTMVHPMFHSDVLKEQGMKLIYIPYTTATTDEIRVQKGVLNADVIIVSDDTEKDLYIGSYKAIGIDISNRVYAIGSPKYDIKEETKTVLFCTSILPFINDPERKLLTYRTIIQREILKGNVVIFRPHPLMADAIRSKCPDVQGKYIDFIKWVKSKCLISENNLHDAMSISDYLITDVSGITKIWVQTDKPFEILE